MNRHQRDVEREIVREGFEYRLLRKRKHLIYEITRSDGRTFQLVTAMSPSDRRSQVQRINQLRKFANDDSP